MRRAVPVSRLRGTLVNVSPYTAKAYEAYYGPGDIDDAKNIFAITVESP